MHIALGFVVFRLTKRRKFSWNNRLSIGFINTVNLLIVAICSWSQVAMLQLLTKWICTVICKWLYVRYSAIGYGRLFASGYVQLFACWLDSYSRRYRPEVTRGGTRLSNGLRLKLHQQNPVLGGEERSGLGSKPRLEKCLLEASPKTLALLFAWDADECRPSELSLPCIFASSGYIKRATPVLVSF